MVKRKKLSIADILIILLFLLAAYLILTRLFGHSATDIQITITLFTFLGGLLYKLWGSLYKLNREFGEFRIRTSNAFRNIADDIKKIKKRVKA